MSRGRWAVAALVLALTGCEAGGPSSGAPDPPSEARAPGEETGLPGSSTPTPGRPEPGSLRTPGAPTRHVHQTRQGACDDVRAGRALRVATSDPTAARILDEWDACVRTDTTPAYTWLHNRTRAVWVLQTAPWDVVQEHRPSRTRLGAVQSGVFHGAGEARGKPPNASAFIHPGESLWIAAKPETVTWQVDLPLTVAWAGAGEIINRLDAHGQQVLTEAVTRRGTAPSAAVTCVQAFHDYALARDDLHHADLQEVLRDGFEALLDDEDCVAAARETTVERPGRTISVLDDVLEVLPGAESTMEGMRGVLEPYARITGVLTLDQDEGVN